jgi:uncharacterized protein YciI
MWYAIIGHDRPDSLEARLAVRQKHLSRLHELREQGRLLTAGPFPHADTAEPGAAGFSGSLIVAEFASLEQASAWANEDPYATAGVYESVSVAPYKKVF